MKEDILQYKDFIGSVHYSSEDEIFYGKIEGITDLVTFEGDTVNKLKKSFQSAVDDYLYLCEKARKPPLKSFKGSFNVRINPKLHQLLFKFAKENGMTLNQAVQRIIVSFFKRDESEHKILE